MPDFTTASAMPLMRSSLTLHPNLFHEFHAMGGVSARLADGDGLAGALSCATRQLPSSRAQIEEATTKRMSFMQTFYQNSIRIGMGTACEL